MLSKSAPATWVIQLVQLSVIHSLEISELHPVIQAMLSDHATAGDWYFSLMTHMWQHLELGKGGHVAIVEGKGAPNIYGLHRPVLNAGKEAVCGSPAALDSLGNVHQHLHAVLAVAPAVLQNTTQQSLRLLATLSCKLRLHIGVWQKGGLWRPSSV